MRECSRRDRVAVRAELDIAVDPVHRSGEERAQDQREQQPIFDRQISRQGKKIKADVLAEERFMLAIRNLIEKRQEHAPVVEFCPSDKRGEQASAAGDRVRQSMAEGFYEIRQRRTAGALPLEGAGMWR